MNAREISDVESVAKLKDRLQKDIYACDLRLSIFFAALTSYKRSSVCRPVPAKFVKEEVDYDSMLKFFKNIPPLTEVLENIDTITSDQRELLNWAVDERQYSLQSRPSSFFPTVSMLCGQIQSTIKPDFIFEVTYSPIVQQKFNNLARDHPTVFAYHGSSLENFHSITHYGLQNHLNKTSLFGEGTYLSTELHVCLNFSSVFHILRENLIGKRLRCIAVCEAVDNHAWVKRGETNKTKVPEKYLVATNNEAVIIRYLLIYKYDKGKKWGSFWLIIFGYCLILLAIALYNSSIFKRNF
ncbi:unnamed protein product [Dimorphilus gyrociliatus]|uniref:Uncharacterized protein n=1 Tax=Dimorphilus gyrociliatus TaxID=2664684 RepID=A0A7I8VSA1_9ANNE|nr:unnamed protein product [Dimorphilus gyrociliatus]